MDHDVPDAAETEYATGNIRKAIAPFAELLVHVVVVAERKIPLGGPPDREFAHTHGTILLLQADAGLIPMLEREWAGIHEGRARGGELTFVEFHEDTVITAVGAHANVERVAHVESRIESLFLISIKSEKSVTKAMLAPEKILAVTRLACVI